MSDVAAGLLQKQPEPETKRRHRRGGPVPGPAAHHGAAHKPALQRVHRLQRHRWVVICPLNMKEKKYFTTPFAYKKPVLF